MTISVVQTTGSYAYNRYGHYTVPVTTSAGSYLVAVVAVHTLATTWLPSAVGDDAGNKWDMVQQVAGSTSGTQQMTNLSIWVCPNAQAVTRVTASLQGFTDSTGFAIRVFEVTGLTNVNSVDVSGTTTVTGTTVTTSCTTTNASDLIIAACAQGIFANTVSHNADSFTTTTELSGEELFDFDDELRLNVAYLIASSTGAKSTSWTGSSSTDFAGLIIAIKGGSTVTTNPNPNWPQLTTKVAFGQQPNAGTAGSYTYGTDISQYVRQVSAHYGIPYELSVAEAGEAQIELYNQDGRFDSQKTSGPYYPNVLDFTPIQMLATWSGQTYGVFTGFMETWPQSWDDIMTGISPCMAVDAIATLARTKLKTAMQHEILMDNPWGYWPLNDGSKSLFAANLSPGAGKNTVLYTNGPRRATDATADFGVQTDLRGDPSSGWGQTAPTPKNDTGWNLYTRVTGTALPVPNTQGMTVEMWAQIPFVPQRNDEMTLFYIKSSATAWATHTLFGLQVNQSSASPGSTVGNLLFNYFDATGLEHQIDLSTRNYADGRWHHYVVWTNTSEYTVYVDGQLVADNFPSPAISTGAPDTIDIGGEQDDWTSTDIGIGSYAHVAIYQGGISGTRVASHFQCGHDGFVEKGGARINRLLTYAGWTGPRLLDDGDVLLGPIGTINGQPLVDALNDVQTWEYGMIWVDGLGRFRFLSRTHRFSLPVVGTFGENTAGGEIPYEGDIQFDYDPTYQYNDIEAQQIFGTSTAQTGQTYYSNDPNGTAAQYWTSSMQVSLLLLSQQAVQAWVSFVYTLLSVPRVRVAQIVLTPSANPSIWGAVLNLEVGQHWQVKRRPTGRSDTITVDVIIGSIEHQIQPGSWKVVLTTVAALSGSVTPDVGPWVLEDPVNGVLDTSTVLGL